MAHEQKTKSQKATEALYPRSVFGRLKEAARFVLGLREVSLTTPAIGRSEDTGFRRITDTSDKELKALDWQRQMSIAHFLWQTNPVAARLIELTTDFVIGSGYTWQSDDAEVEELIKRHWDDPDNAWDMKQYERAQELGVFGSLVIKPFVNNVNGHVKISTIDPQTIKKIIPHPDKSGVAQALVVAPQGASGEEQTWQIIHVDEDPASPTFGLLTGDVFYFPVNKLSFTHRGISDLFRLADWLDAFDQFLFNLMERIVFLNSHLYDISIKDADDEVIIKKAQELEANPPKAGGFRVHSDRETWSPLAPKINSAEVEEVARIVKMLILGSAGIPEHWFAEGGNVNKATAGEMGAPTFRKLERRQLFFTGIIENVLQYSLDQAVARGRLSREKRDKFTVLAPDVSAKDVQTLVASLGALTDSLVGAIDANFVDRKKAAEIWTAQATEFGVDLTPPNDDEIERREDDEIDRTEKIDEDDDEDVYAAIEAHRKKKKKSAEHHQTMSSKENAAAPAADGASATS